MSKKEISSGAEKAEKLTNSQKTKSQKKPSQKKTSVANVKHSEKTQPVKELSAKEQKRQEKQEARAERKLKMAELRMEKKQRRLEKKLAHKEKRAERRAEIMQARAERRAAKAERRDMLRAETREQRAERKLREREQKREALTLKRRAHAEAVQAKREHRLALREQKRAQKKDRTPGFGGWLAAVISLGVITLALGTMVTFSWMGYNGIQANMAKIQTESIYELNSVMDNLDANLSKARVANSAEDQTTLFTDIAVESEMAEMILERMPVDMHATQNLSSFYNKMSDTARAMLGNVAANQPLTEGQLQSIEYMYSTNLALKRSFNELTSTATADDIMRALNGKSGVISSTFDNIESNVIQTPKEIHDGPFSESIEKVSAKNLDDLKEISAPEAQELATKYFSEYHVSEAKCTGETLAKELVCYNVALTTEDGDMMAQISKKGGKVVLFDSYKDCSDKNFSTERCITIATDFLETLGYTDMKAVWASENGTTCNLNFAYTVNDTVVYPDIIKVKVCEQRGIVTGIEALSYVLNHTQRTIESPALSLEEAQKNVDKKVEIKGSRLTIIPYHGEEALAYEFYGSVDKNDYYVYIDAATGKEIKIFTVVGTAQGRALL